MTAKPTGCGIYLNLYFHFFALVSWQRTALRSQLHTQCPQNSAESGERSVLTLGSLGLSAVCGILREADIYTN